MSFKQPVNLYNNSRAILKKRTAPNCITDKKSEKQNNTLPNSELKNETGNSDKVNTFVPFKSIDITSEKFISVFSSSNDSAISNDCLNNVVSKNETLTKQTPPEENKFSNKFIKKRVSPILNLSQSKNVSPTDELPSYTSKASENELNLNQSKSAINGDGNNVKEPISFNNSLRPFSDKSFIEKDSFVNSKSDVLAVTDDNPIALQKSTEVEKKLLKRRAVPSLSINSENKLLKRRAAPSLSLNKKNVNVKATIQNETIQFKLNEIKEKDSSKHVNKTVEKVSSDISKDNFISDTSNNQSTTVEQVLRAPEKDAESKAIESDITVNKDESKSFSVNKNVPVNEKENSVKDKLIKKRATPSIFKRSNACSQNKNIVNEKLSKLNELSSSPLKNLFNVNERITTLEKKEKACSSNDFTSNIAIDKYLSTNKIELESKNFNSKGSVHSFEYPSSPHIIDETSRVNCKDVCDDEIEIYEDNFERVTSDILKKDAERNDKIIRKRSIPTPSGKKSTVVNVTLPKICEEKLVNDNNFNPKVVLPQLAEIVNSLNSNREEEIAISSKDTEDCNAEKKRVEHVVRVYLNSWPKYPRSDPFSEDPQHDTREIRECGSISIWKQGKYHVAYCDLTIQIDLKNVPKNWIYVQFNKLFKEEEESEVGIPEEQVVTEVEQNDNSSESNLYISDKENVEQEVVSHETGKQEVFNLEHKVGRPKRSKKKEIDKKTVEKGESNVIDPEEEDSSNSPPAKKKKTTSFCKMSSLLKQKWKKDGIPDETKLSLKDFIVYVPNSEPMSTDALRLESQSQPISDSEECDKVEENEGPKLIIRDGEIIVDPKSTMIKQTAPKAIKEEKIDRYKRPSDSKDLWDLSDTIKFYNTLWKYGIDFSMITSTFPTKTRYTIKRKYNFEQKQHPHLINEVLSGKNGDFKSVMRQLIIISGNEALKKKKLLKKKVPQPIENKCNETKLKRKKWSKKKKEPINKDLLKKQAVLSKLFDNKAEIEVNKWSDVDPIPEIIISDDVSSIDLNDIITFSTNVVYDHLNIVESVSFNPSNIVQPVDFNVTISHEPPNKVDNLQSEPNTNITSLTLEGC